MAVEYDNYYQTENYFGEPYPELLEFYSSQSQKGKLLDLGCGQGRDAIPLARLGYKVTGVDHSQVGIQQLNEIARKENLSLKGMVSDIFDFSHFDEFDFILLDSMFHFGKKYRERETQLLQRIFNDIKSKALVTICIQDSEHKVDTLHTIISTSKEVKVVGQTSLVYEFQDKESDHYSKITYEMLTLEKLGN